MPPQAQGADPPPNGKMKVYKMNHKAGDRLRYISCSQDTSLVERGEGGQAPPDPGCLQSVPVPISIECTPS